MRKLALALIAALPLTAAAKDNPDESFFHEAAQAGHAEVQAGKVAHTKAKSPAVKKFAEMMVRDHAASNDDLGKIAGAKGVALPAGPSRAQKAMNEKTEKESGDSFDKSYIQDQIKAHEDAIDLFQREVSEAKDADAKAFAAKGLPTLKAHLERITEIAATR